MKIVSKFIMSVLAGTLVFNSGSMILANEELVSEEVVEEIVEIEDEIIDLEVVEEVFVEEEIVSDVEVLTEDVDDRISDLVSNEEELIAALSVAVGDVVISFDVDEILLNSTLNIDSNKLNSLTFKSTVSDSVKFINNGEKKHIEIKGTGDITLNMYDVVLSGIVKSDGGIKAETVNNITLNGLTIKDNVIKVKSWMSSFVTIKAKGDVTFNDLVTDNNTLAEDSEQDTGLISVDVVDGIVTFKNANVKNTTIKNLMGSNIKINGEKNEVVLKDVLVSDSSSRQGSAGFYIFSKKDVLVNVDNAVLKNNEANVGNYASLHFRSYHKVNLNIINSIFDNNFSYRGGAAVYVEGQKGMNVSINDSDFSNNKAVRINYDKETGETTGLPSNGGAVYLSTTGGTDSTFEIKNSSFDNNFAGTGGAVAIFTQGTYVDTLIDNTSFTNNTADYSSGALSYYFGGSSEVVGALTINNSQFISNEVTGDDKGPKFYRGGDGGALSINKLRNYPNLLKVDNTTFKDNKALIKNYWHYDKNSDGALDKAYTDNITSTSYSDDLSLNNVKNRNNIFNGDDVHFDKTAFVVLDFSEDDYEDLVVNNYNTEKLVFFNAYTGTHFSELTKPTADGYTFIGWKDMDGNMWNFDEHILKDDMDKGQYHIKAVWAKTVETTSVLTVNYVDTDLNPINDSLDILGQKDDSYNIDVIDIEGYKFINVLDDKLLSGLFTDENIEVTLIYEMIDDNEGQITPDPKPEDEDKDDIEDLTPDEDVKVPVDNDKVEEDKKTEVKPGTVETGLNDLSINYLLLIIASASLLLIFSKYRKVKKI